MSEYWAAFDAYWQDAGWALNQLQAKRWPAALAPTRKDPEVGRIVEELAVAKEQLDLAERELAVAKDQNKLDAARSIAGQRLAQALANAHVPIPEETQVRKNQWLTHAVVRPVARVEGTPRELLGVQCDQRTPESYTLVGRCDFSNALKVWCKVAPYEKGDEGLARKLEGEYEALAAYIFSHSPVGAAAAQKEMTARVRVTRLQDKLNAALKDLEELKYFPDTTKLEAELRLLQHERSTAALPKEDPRTRLDAQFWTDVPRYFDEFVARHENLDLVTRATGTSPCALVETEESEYGRLKPELPSQVLPLRPFQRLPGLLLSGETSPLHGLLVAYEVGSGKSGAAVEFIRRSVEDFFKSDASKNAALFDVLALFPNDALIANFQADVSKFYKSLSTHCTRERYGNSDPGPTQGNRDQLEPEGGDEDKESGEEAGRGADQGGPLKSSRNPNHTDVWLVHHPTDGGRTMRVVFHPYSNVIPQKLRSHWADLEPENVDFKNHDATVPENTRIDLRQAETREKYRTPTRVIVDEVHNLVAPPPDFGDKVSIRNKARHFAFYISRAPHVRVCALTATPLPDAQHAHEFAKLLRFVSGPKSTLTLQDGPWEAELSKEKSSTESTRQYRARRAAAHAKFASDWFDATGNWLDSKKQTEFENQLSGLSVFITTKFDARIYPELEAPRGVRDPTSSDFRPLAYRWTPTEPDKLSEEVAERPLSKRELAAYRNKRYADVRPTYLYVKQPQWLKDAQQDKNSFASNEKRDTDFNPKLLALRAALKNWPGKHLCYSRGNEKPPTSTVFWKFAQLFGNWKKVEGQKQVFIQHTADLQNSVVWDLFNVGRSCDELLQNDTGDGWEKRFVEAWTTKYKPVENRVLLLAGRTKMVTKDYANDNSFPEDKAKRAQHAALALYNHKDNAHGQYIQLLVVDGEGKEGLNLRAVRFVHSLTPFPEGGEQVQVLGRAMRFCSHTHLEKDEERKVRLLAYAFEAEDVRTTSPLDGRTVEELKQDGTGVEVEPVGEVEPAEPLQTRAEPGRGEGSSPSGETEAHSEASVPDSTPAPQTPSDSVSSAPASAAVPQTVSDAPASALAAAPFRTTPSAPPANSEPAGLQEPELPSVAPKSGVTPKRETFQDRWPHLFPDHSSAVGKGTVLPVPSGVQSSFQDRWRLTLPAVQEVEEGTSTRQRLGAEVALPDDSSAETKGPTPLPSTANAPDGFAKTSLTRSYINSKGLNTQSKRGGRKGKFAPPVAAVDSAQPTPTKPVSAQADSGAAAFGRSKNETKTQSKRGGRKGKVAPPVAAVESNRPTPTKSAETVATLRDKNMAMLCEEALHSAALDCKLTAEYMHTMKCGATNMLRAAVGPATEDRAPKVECHRLGSDGTLISSPFVRLEYFQYTLDGFESFCAKEKDRILTVTGNVKPSPLEMQVAAYFEAGDAFSAMRRQRATGGGFGLLTRPNFEAAIQDLLEINEPRLKVLKARLLARFPAEKREQNSEYHTQVKRFKLFSIFVQTFRNT
jgi:hypothetical protein